MADRIIILPATGLEAYLPPDMVRDLRQIAALELEQVRAFAESLKSAPGFVGDERLKGMVAKHFTAGGELFGSIKRTLDNVPPGTAKETIGLIRRWSENRQEQGGGFRNEELDKLNQNLEILTSGFPAVLRQQKAMKLRRATGRVLAGVDCICDLRPVFNEDRDVVDGLIPVVIVRLDYQTQQEADESFEIVLTESTLKMLMEKLEMADKKINVLTKQVQAWVPDSSPDAEA